MGEGISYVLSEVLVIQNFIKIFQCLWDFSLKTLTCSQVFILSLFKKSSPRTRTTPGMAKAATLAQTVTMVVRAAALTMLLISRELNMWKLCPWGLMRFKPLSSWPVGSFLVCFPLLFCELFFFRNPPWLQGLKDKFSFCFAFLMFPHNSGFLVNRLPQVYQSS